jgi:uncharacterized membrane protein
MTPWPEIFITAAGFLILILYHVHLIYQIRTAPMTTSIGITNHLRREWVQTVMAERRDILAVQTLRNWVMASSFLASAAILIGLGTLNAIFSGEKPTGLSQALNVLGTHTTILWLVKLMLIVLDFFFAFFNFTLSIRYYNHASFVINVPTAEDPIVTYDTVTKIINRGTTHYTLGMRGFYLAIPFILWLFGSTWLLLGAMILTLVLYKLDRTP